MSKDAVRIEIEVDGSTPPSPPLTLNTRGGVQYNIETLYNTAHHYMYHMWGSRAFVVFCVFVQCNHEHLWLCPCRQTGRSRRPVKHTVVTTLVSVLKDIESVFQQNDLPESDQVGQCKHPRLIGVEASHLKI